MKRAFLLFLMVVTAMIQCVATESDTKYRYYYIEAVRQMDMGNYALAFELFNRCKTIAPNAAETDFALARLYIIGQQDSLGFALIKRTAELEPSNTEFADRLATIYLYTNEIDSATAVYERLTELLPDRTEYLEMLTRIYSQTKDYEKMLSALNRLELREGSDENLALMKMQAYSGMGDQQGAYNELKNLVDAHPYDMSLKVMMGNWLLSNGRKEEALTAFLEALKEEPDNAKGQMSLMDFYRAEGQTAEADSLLYNILVNPRTESKTRVLMMSRLINSSEEHGGDSANVMRMFDSVLRLPQKTPEMAAMKATYLKMKNAPIDSIRSSWERVLDIAPEYIEARLQLINIMWEDSIDEKVIDECKKAVEYVPDEPALYFYLGLAQHINKKYDDAITTLKRGASHLTKDTDKNVATDIYYLLGDIMHKQGHRTEAYAAYDSSLIYNPDHVITLNNYAYFLSLDGKELKKAEKMSYRAITAEPNNGTYLDTYAWILYQQGRYEEARIYIEQAISCEERNNMAQTDSIIIDNDNTSMQGDSIEIVAITIVGAEILDHAGDIYFKLNQKEKALEMWNRALEEGVENEAVLRRKIRKTKK